MILSDMLKLHGIKPEAVLVFRHKPREFELNKVLPWLAAERPDLYNAYQRSQYPKVEKAMTRAKYIASFIRRKPGEALFIGLYQINGYKQITRKEHWEIPENKELYEYGMSSDAGESGRDSYLWFNLELMNFYHKWKGKMVIQWPGLERSWWRWATKNVMPVVAVLEESELDAAMPAWNEIELSWGDLKAIPKRWKSKLEEWRGIYYIFDRLCKKGYVGSAYGENNLYGRWMTYAKSGHGGNHLLKKRDPHNFVFTILRGLDDANRRQSFQ